MNNEQCKERCKGICTKHYFVEGRGFVRCELVDNEVFYDGFSSIPKKYRHRTWDDFEAKASEGFKFSKLLASRLLENKYPKFYLIFSGQNHESKDFLCSLILKDLIVSGKKCSTVSLAVLTDLYFNSKKDYYSFVDADILCFELGTEIANSSSPSIVMEMFRERDLRQKYTFFISRFFLSDFSTKYSSDLRNFFSMRNFKEVRV